MKLNEEKLKGDILFQIDMQLYNEFNDKICEINEHLGNIYTYKDLRDIEDAEKEKERTLLREAIKKQQKEIEEYKNVIRNSNKNWISKDKIREKIKELEITRNSSVTDNGFTIMSVVISNFKELLEEK